MARYKYTPEVLATAAAAARNVTDVLRLLGVRVSGGAHAHISRQLKRFGIDTSHFTRQAHNRGRRGERRTTSAQLLVVLAKGWRYRPMSRKATTGWPASIAALRPARRSSTCSVGSTPSR
ncbi:hypothetical protein AB0C15_15005 [Micromonospora sp. NPDC048835]|uniref:hypothetical protein n=1 Tax=Micromonospora sp. NPDC048835 TaxID=3155147 RepID=UPI0033EE6494